MCWGRRYRVGKWPPGKHYTKLQHSIVIKNIILRSSLVAQWVKDLAMLLQQPRSLLWHGFNTWPRNFHMSQMQPKKKQKQKTLSPKHNPKPKPVCVGLILLILLLTKLYDFGQVTLPACGSVSSPVRCV